MLNFTSLDYLGGNRGDSLVVVYCDCVTIKLRLCELLGEADTVLLAFVPTSGTKRFDQGVRMDLYPTQGQGVGLTSACKGNGYSTSSGLRQSFQP